MTEIINSEKKNIAVIFGGVSSEYEVSLQSAAAVLENFPERYNAVPVWITRGGEWRLFRGEPSSIREDKLPADSPRVILPPDRGAGCLLTLGSSNVRIPLAAAFPVMHGIGGEDGTLQGLIELSGLPLCGCGTLASALCMDKERSHKLVSAYGIAVPRSVLLRKGEAVGEDVLRTTGLPAFVKPLRGGSSFGITRITDAAELHAALEKAFAYDCDAVVEQAIDGVEVGCAVMGERGALTIGEADMIELSGGFFDFEEKYTLKTSRILCPAPLAEELTERVKWTAAAIYNALGCSGFARVDMFLSGSDIVFNEVNTIPGFTEHSRFPIMMKAAGCAFSEVLERIIDGAVRE
ncbi:MAG: D-alanine--D-alanine ligase [Oscillospiraceae bacterium]|nr:D-alanine--D-alanine ligase [Oscillospiraceae bacterium]